MENCQEHFSEDKNTDKKTVCFLNIAIKKKHQQLHRVCLRNKEKVPFIFMT